MLVPVQLLHSWHELNEVLHSDQLAIKLIVALGEPYLEERGNIHENSQEAD